MPVKTVAPARATGPEAAPSDPSVEASAAPARRRVRVLAIAAVTLLAVTACTSDPGPKRVAQDIIEAEAYLDPELDEECLLTELDKFSDDDLRAIAQDLAASNTERNAEGEAALLAYQRSLEACA